MVEKRVARMRGITRSFFLAIAISFLLPGTLMAWPWGPKTLVTINGQAYTTEDFDHWWINWKDKDTPFPDTPDPFIEWHLLAQEAERMELYTSPVYRHKVLTFLKARALMILKGEEVNSKIDVSDEALRKEYYKSYSPIWSLDIFFFKKMETAKDVSGRLASGRLSVQELVERAKKDREIAYQSGKLRPMSLPKEWKPALMAMESKGSVSSPIPWGKNFVVLILKETKQGDEEDFERVKNAIKKRVWDREQARLTAELVERLKKKYHVRLDRALFEVLDPKDVPEEFMDKPLVTTDKGDISVKLFLALVKKELDFRKKYHFKGESMQHLKERVLNGMISQTLISWESIERHYEERPPFKWVYRFYCQHRMIRELEKKLFEPQVKVTEEDVKKYYQDHIKEFTRPETVSIAVLEDDKKLAEKIWGDITRGEDFFEAARKYYSRDVPVQKIPFNHLDPKVKEVVQHLAEGEVSPPFEVKGHAVLVKLVERTSATPLPLDHVKKEIEKRLREEIFRSIKKKYVEKLKAMSEIKVNEDVWAQIKKEMSHGTAS